MVGYLRFLGGLRDRGNTVIVVEHDSETLLACDHLIEVGPGAGTEGGQLMFTGDVDACMKSKESSSGSFLSGIEKVEKDAKNKSRSSLELYYSFGI